MTPTPTAAARVSGTIKALYERACEVVHHDHDCPAIGGNGDADCKCDAVPFLNDFEALSAIQPDPEPQPVAMSAPATPSSAGMVSVEAAGWQSIETAPTDGNEFLIAYSDGTVRAGRYLDNSHTRWPWKGVRPMYGAERAGRKITHWMPLPEPPALRALDGEGGR